MMDGYSLVIFFANSGVSPIGVKKAFVLFEVFMVLMAVFVLLLTFMVMRRWFHRQSHQHRLRNRKESKLADPWKEAANRIKPFDKS